MTTSKKKGPAHTTAADSSAAVDAFLATLEHPLRAEAATLRALILGADPSIAEGIKWNAPSYRTGEYFATTHLRSKKGVGVIFHLGAKARTLPAGGVTIDDPARLLKWLAKDRAMVEFADAQEIEAHRAAFVAILRQWIRYV